MSISTNQKPTIYRNLYENTGPGRLFGAGTAKNCGKSFIQRWSGLPPGFVSDPLLDHWDEGCAWLDPGRSGIRGLVFKHPVNTRRWTHADLMLGQRRRRWTNIKLALVQRLVCAGCSLVRSGCGISLESIDITGYARRWRSVGLVLAQRRGRWTNTKPTLGQCLVCLLGISVMRGLRDVLFFYCSAKAVRNAFD